MKAAGGRGWSVAELVVGLLWFCFGPGNFDLWCMVYYDVTAWPDVQQAQSVNEELCKRKKVSFHLFLNFCPFFLNWREKSKHTGQPLTDDVRDTHLSDPAVPDWGQSPPDAPGLSSPWRSWWRHRPPHNWEIPRSHGGSHFWCVSSHPPLPLLPQRWCVGMLPCSPSPPWLHRQPAAIGPGNSDVQRS